MRLCVALCWLLTRQFEERGVNLPKPPFREPLERLRRFNHSICVEMTRETAPRSQLRSTTRAVQAFDARLSG